jgi:ankyrin repeat protein
VESKSNNGRTPLSWAAEKGHKTVVKLLVAAKADVNSKNPDGRPPLALAAGNGFNKVGNC